MTTTDLRRPPIAVRAARSPWWVRILALYAGSRIVSTAILLVVAHVARRGSRIGARAGLLDVLTAWDGQWYQLIALHGYPRGVPTSGGHLLQNAWAFLPLYPELTRLLSFGRPSAWPMVAVGVSVVSGAVAAVLLGALVRRRTGDRGALVAVSLFVLSPVAFVLEATYAEALGLALLFGVLLLVDRRRPLVAIPVVLAFALTRPGAQAVALSVVIVHVGRVLDARRAGRPIPVRDWIGSVALAVVAAVAGQLWPWIAAALSGDPAVYVDTELVWRTGWFDTAQLTLVLPWVSAARFWFGSTLGPVVLGLLAALALAVVLSPAARRAGAVVVAWSVSWTAYLIAVFFPQSSVFRLLMPLAPLGAVLARVRLRWVLPLLGLSVALQAVWAFCVYGYWQHYWTVL